MRCGIQVTRVLVDFLHPSACPSKDDWSKADALVEAVRLNFFLVGLVVGEVLGDQCVETAKSQASGTGRNGCKHRQGGRRSRVVGAREGPEGVWERPTFSLCRWRPASCVASTKRDRVVSDVAVSGPAHGWVVAETVETWAQEALRVRWKATRRPCCMSERGGGPTGRWVRLDPFEPGPGSWGAGAL